jgi:hypothetical protein
VVGGEWNGRTSTEALSWVGVGVRRGVRYLTVVGGEG